jgi:hypothetical protein
MVDLTLSGTYSVVVKRSNPGHPRHPLISNELTLEIAEPPTPGR